MKGTYISFFTAVLAVLAGTIGAEAGVLTSSGDWSTTTITADETVNLTGTVNVYGTITVKNGATLTINSNGGSYLIQNILDNSEGAQLAGIFKVAAGSTLKILGTSENKITIGGGRTSVTSHRTT